MKKILTLIACSVILFSCNKEDDPKKVLRKITVSEITITKYPAANSTGSGWDIGSGPDIYPTIELNGVEIYDSPDYYGDVNNPNEEYKFPVATPLKLDPNVNYTLRLHDLDPTSSEFMISTQFKFTEAQDKDDGNPLIDKVEFNGTSLSYRFTVAFQYDYL